MQYKVVLCIMNVFILFDYLMLALLDFSSGSLVDHEGAEASMCFQVFPPQGYHKSGKSYSLIQLCHVTFSTTSF